MPIEIKELHIRVNVNSEDCGSGREDEKTRPAQSSGETDMDRMVELCAERVLEVIKREQQR